MKSIEEVLPLLQTPQNIFIVAHHKPDGDAIGSTLGLMHYFHLRGHVANVVMPSAAPHFLDWMPGAGSVIDFEKEEGLALDLLKDATLIFILDLNDLSRTKTMEEALKAATVPRILIDHHLFPKDQFAIGISDSTKSSTCEMVYDFIKMSGDLKLINLDIAACLYTGTMTDTGSFRFTSTTAGRPLYDRPFPGTGPRPRHHPQCRLR